MKTEKKFDLYNNYIIFMSYKVFLQKNKEKSNILMEE